MNGLRTTRRSFLLGASSALAAPAMIPVGGLEFGLPRYRYYVLLDQVPDVFDIVRSDGKYMGMIFPYEIPNLGLLSPGKVIEHSLDGVTDNHVKHHEGLLASNLYEHCVPLGVHLANLHRKDKHLNI